MTAVTAKARRTFVASFDLIEVGPLPSGSYAYRIDGLLSYHKYHNAVSARYDARRVQVVLDNGRIEPLESAVKFGRVRKPTHRPFTKFEYP